MPEGGDLGFVADPSFYVERKLPIPFFNEKTLGPKFIPISCVHGMGQSKFLQKNVQTVLSSNGTVLSCLYDGGIDRIIYAADIFDEAHPEKPTKKDEIDLVADHLELGGTFVCIKDAKALGTSSVKSKAENWIEELLIENLTAFKRYSHDFKILSIDPHASVEQIEKIFLENHVIEKKDSGTSEEL